MPYEEFIVEKYHNRVITILREAKEKRLLKRIAVSAGIHPPRLTEILTNKRRLTAYYLAKMLNGGVMELSQILNGRKIEDLPRAERLFFTKLTIPDELVELYEYLTTNKGLDVIAILKALKSSS